MEAGDIQPVPAETTGEVVELEATIEAEQDQAGQVAGTDGENNLETDQTETAESTSEDEPAKTDEDDDHEDDQALTGKLPEKVQRAIDARIAKLTAKRKAVETERDALKAERDELRTRTERVTDAVVLKAAQETGVVPDLMGKPDAERIAEYRTAKRAVQYYGDWLEDNTEADATLEVGGKEYSRAQVREGKRQWQARLEGLEDVPAKLAELRKSTREVLELGMAAKKAGWKPGQKPAAPPAKPGAAVKPLPKPPLPAGPAAGAPARRAPGAPVKKSVNVDGVKDEDGLARLIEEGLA